MVFCVGHCVGTVICFDRLCMATVTKIVRLWSVLDRQIMGTDTRTHGRRGTGAGLILEPFVR